MCRKIELVDTYFNKKNNAYSSFKEKTKKGKLLNENKYKHQILVTRENVFMLHFNSCSRSNLKSITIISGKRQTQNVPSGNQRWPEQVITQIYSGLWIPVATINMAYLFPSYDKSLTSDNYILKVVHEDIYTQHITTALTVWMVHVIYYTVHKNTRTQTKH